MSNRHYLIRVGDVISQAINTILLNGEPDESVSGRSYREGVLLDRWRWRKAMKVIDTLFNPFESEHCRRAYIADLERARQRIINTDKAAEAVFLCPRGERWQ